MRLLKATVLALSLGALAACGSNNSESRVLTKSIVGGLAPLVGIGNKAAAEAATPKLTRAQIDASPAPMLLAEIPSVGGAAVVTPVAVNGGKTTWRSSDGKALILQLGFLVATRGLLEDLQAAEVSGFGAALGPQGGTYQRQMEWLDGRNQLKREVFTCSVGAKGRETLTFFEKSYNTTLYEDRCTGERIIFVNRYWIDSGKKLRQSRQWVSESVGYLQTQAL